MTESQIIDRFIAQALPGLRPDVLSGPLDRSDIDAVVGAYIEEKHPDARCALIYGSYVKRTAKSLSDIDIVVIKDIVDMKKSCLVYLGIPIECHVLSLDSMLKIINLSIPLRNTLFAKGMIESEFFSGDFEIYKKIRESASLAMAYRGKYEDKLYYARANATSIVLECISNQSRDDVLSIMTCAYESICDLFFMKKGMKSYKGKLLSRIINVAGIDLLDNFTKEFNHFVSGGAKEPVIHAIIRIIEFCGGPIWSGYDVTSRVPS
ncbi:nucleotidyltransferase domain-containing protein [Nitrospirillum pindoramense]|nr:nucleotidyltransferase domain-containing protein [Nitrospirillum amazonense]